MADLNKIIEDLSSLSVVEAAELSKKLEEKWGVSAAAPVAVAAPAAAGGADSAAEEKSEFEVFLSSLSPEQLNKLNKLTIKMKYRSAFINLSSLNYIRLNLYFNIFEVNGNLFYLNTGI